MAICTGRRCGLTLIEFRPLTIGEITEDDLHGLEMGIAANPCRPTMKQVKASIAKGESVVWRFSKDGEWKGVILILVRLEQEIPDIFAWLVGGSEFKENIPYLEGVMVEYAKLIGVKFLRSHAMEHIVRHMKPFGYKEEYVCIVKEI